MDITSTTQHTSLESRITGRLIFRIAGLRKVCILWLVKRVLFMFHLLQFNHPARIGHGMALSGSSIWLGTEWSVFLSPFSTCPLIQFIRPRMTDSNTIKSSNVRGGHQQFRRTTFCPVFDGDAGFGLWFTYHLSLNPTLPASTLPNISPRALKPLPTRLPSLHLNPTVLVPCRPYPAPILSATQRSSSTYGGETTETGHDVTGLCALSGEMDESSSCGSTGLTRMGSLQPDGRLCGLEKRPIYSMEVTLLKFMSSSPTPLSKWTSLERR